MRTVLNRWTAVATAASCGLLMVSSTAVLAHKNDPAATDAPFIAAEAWAFPVSTAPSPQVLALIHDGNKVLRVPGSTRSYRLSQLSLFNTPDWFPQAHPPMPEVVAHGRKPAWACSFCHLPDGEGEPASASLAGLPEAYILEQIRAFRSGERGKGPWPTTQDMDMEAQRVTDADLQQAAKYFSALHFKPQTRVVETASVPKTYWDSFSLVPDPSKARESIGERIVEVPANFKLYWLRDDQSGFIAYVPPRSIERGAVIAANGAGAAPACEACHGARLEGQTIPGIGVVPPFAGRSPTYIVRELILFRLGKRTNPGATPMRAEVAHLTLKDMIDVAAYAASRKP